jgi:hypothetical protein
MWPEEPDAVVPHVRICGGPARRLAGLPDPDAAGSQNSPSPDTWTLTDATWEPVSRAHLDLSFLIDVHLFVSYRGRLAISE